MDKKKVIVVDDSAFMRKMIGDMIDTYPNFEVVARLKNGKELVDKIEELQPEIVTLDVEMPIMDGLTTLKELKNKKHNAKIVMVSSLTSEGSKMTIECLMNGAIDFIQKPSGSISLDIDKIKQELQEKFNTISKVRAVPDRYIEKKPKQIEKKEVVVTSTPNRNVKGNKIEAVLIGSSTGGPKAVQKVLTPLKNLGVPVIIVQHMPKGFTKAFASRLNNICSLNVVECEDGMTLTPDTVYIAQGGYHLEIKRDKTTSLTDGKTIWGVKPAVDKMLSTGATAYRGNVLSVILTGMGRDGAEGTAMVKDFGGTTIAEDESTSVIFGMPKAAIETGKVDYILPLDEIANKIMTLVKGER
ncbi:MAG: protein-glutamate methylesterase/protein-glutamine glutaminase [Clostridium sp.]